MSSNNTNYAQTDAQKVRMKNVTSTKNLLIAAIALAVVGGASFYGGMQYQLSKLPGVGSGLGQRMMATGQFADNLRGNRTGDQRQGGLGTNQQGGQGFGRPLTGDIISQDDKSITVKLIDGSSKIVLLSDATKVLTSTDAAKSDLKVGQHVTVMGTTGTDGSVTAENVMMGGLLNR